MMYYNTTHESGQELARARSAAAGQGKVILEYFLANPRAVLSPGEIQIVTDLTGAPLTSIRRAVTNLTHDGYLYKTTKKVRTRYGRNAYCWALRAEYGGVSGAQEFGLPLWQRCSECDEYVCNLHHCHTGECDCPPIDEMDFNPYKPGSLEKANG